MAQVKLVIGLMGLNERLLGFKLRVEFCKSGNAGFNDRHFLLEWRETALKLSEVLLKLSSLAEAVALGAGGWLWGHGAAVAQIEGQRPETEGVLLG